MDQFLFGEHVIMNLGSTHYPSQATRVVPMFQNTFRLGIQTWGIHLTGSISGRA